MHIMDVPLRCGFTNVTGPVDVSWEVFLMFSFSALWALEQELDLPKCVPSDSWIMAKKLRMITTNVYPLVN